MTKLKQQTVGNLLLSKLHPFLSHPFRVRDDAEMVELAQSIIECGVLVPALVRIRKAGGYEIISGHRRVRACALAGLEMLPAIISDLDDDAAAIVIVDSNLHREHISHSERARAYRMKLEAIKRQGMRHDLTCRQNVGKLDAADIVGKDVGKSGRQIQRYIHLTELIPPLLELVDEKKIAVSPAIELSVLTSEEQFILLDAMDAEQSTPSLSQAQQLRKCSEAGSLTFEGISKVLSTEKKDTWGGVTLAGEKLKSLFPDSYTPWQMEQTIWKLLEEWGKANQTKRKVS